MATSMVAGVERSIGFHSKKSIARNLPISKISEVTRCMGGKSDVNFMPVLCDYQAAIVKVRLG